MIQVVDDLVVHRAAMLWMRVQHQRDRGCRLIDMVVAGFETAFRAVHDDVGHGQ